MNYGSLCSGIEAASVAWHPLGWRPAFFSEIEKFPSNLLARHYPKVPNHGDMTKFKDWPDATLDVLVGGTPCQSFSVAGLRKGLADPRGNLMLTYLAIADRYRPRWLVWENVPGVLSSGGGRDFGSFLGGLGELGYGFAYRVLDAQFVRVESHARAVPQRRRRVFVVGYLGDWRRAAAVLFERQSLSGHPAPRREAGKGIAPTIAARTRGGGGLGTDFGCDGGLIADEVALCLNAGGMGRQDSESESESESFVAHALTASGFDASEDGTGQGTPIVPIAFDCKGTQVQFSEGASPTLRSMAHDGSHQNGGGQLAIAIQERAVSENVEAGPGGAGYSDSGAAYTLEARHHVQAVAFAENSRAEIRLCGGDGNVSSQLTTGGGKPGQGLPTIATQWAVRRLTPVECARLQAFPDDYLELTYADADEAHAAQILHDLWKEVGAKAFEEQGWRIGISAALLTPKILLAGVHVGWISWEVAGRCVAARGSIQGENFKAESIVRTLRLASQLGCSPYRRESFEQFAGQLGCSLQELPLVPSQARAVLRSSELWSQAQAQWPLRYAFSTGKASLNPDGPRYKALGNSMAVNVMAWIGQRIAHVEAMA